MELWYQGKNYADDVEKILERFQPLEKDVVRMHFGLGCIEMTHMQIAKKVHMSERQVDNIFNTAIQSAINDLDGFISFLKSEVAVRKSRPQLYIVASNEVH